MDTHTTALVPAGNPGMDLRAYSDHASKLRESSDIAKLAHALVQAQKVLANPPRNREVEVRTKTGGKYTFRYATLDQITSFGVNHVRQLVYWRDIAPSPDSKTKPAGFDASNPAAYPTDKWDNLDGLVNAAAARGVSVTLTLTGPVPKWATKSKRDNVTNPIPAEFGAFATAIGRRYGDRVSTWSIWKRGWCTGKVAALASGRNRVMARAGRGVMLKSPIRTAGPRAAMSARRRA